MPEHSHTHEISTGCGEDCGREHHERFTHVHDNGHEIHQHRLSGVKLLTGIGDDLKEVEKEIERKPTGNRIWDGE